MIRPPAPSLRRRLLTLSTLVAMTAALAGTQAADAAPRTGASGTPPVVTLTVTDADADAAVAFWTPERRAAARDADVGPADAARPADGASSGPTADAADPVEQVPAVPHIGRMYFERNGFSYYCTANVVDAPNASTIATAGHCASSKEVFSTKLVFYPGVEGDQTPYGAWPIQQGSIASGWFESGDTDAADDTSFFALRKDASGAGVASVVGSSPVLFGQSAAQLVAAFGYPVEGRFDGHHLQRCIATAAATAPDQVVFPCAMTGGASGGPIFTGGSADGSQFANIATLDYNHTHNAGPLWGGTQRSAYDATAAIGG